MRRGGRRKKVGRGMFNVRRAVETPPPTAKFEEVVIEDVAAATPPVMLRPKKAKRALPGERLLRQLHRDRTREQIIERIKKMNETAPRADNDV